MNIRFLLAPIFALTSAAFAADLPGIPADPIAQKKGLLFSDDIKIWNAEPATP